jgi:hypothetical protein
MALAAIVKIFLEKFTWPKFAYEFEHLAQRHTSGPWPSSGKARRDQAGARTG